MRCKDELPSLVDLGTAKERHPYRVMLAYERQFKREIAARLEAGDKQADIEAGRQLALLFLMGLFDRPMECGDREALLAPPEIRGLTVGLIGLGRNRIDETVESLRSARAEIVPPIVVDKAVHSAPACAARPCPAGAIPGN